MLLVPTWDLFYMSMGLVVVLYSCILGREWTAKIILASYAAILATDAFGMVFQSFLMSDQHINISRGFPDKEAFLFGWKMVFFVLMLIGFAKGAGYVVNLVEADSIVIRWGMRVVYGVMSGLLLVTALLVYTSGASFIFGAFGGAGFLNQVLTDPAYLSAPLVRALAENAKWIFLLPAATLLIRIR